MIEHTLQIGRMAETRFQLRPVGHRAGKPLVIRLHRSRINVPPYRGFDILADGTTQARAGRCVKNFQRALVAVDTQPQLVEMTCRPAAGVNDTQRAIGIFGHHDKAVIGIQHIFADMVVVRLLESLETRRSPLHIAADRIGREVENMNADIAQNAVGTVPG